MMNKWKKINKDLEYVRKNLEIFGKNHIKISKKQLKIIENLRDSWGYPRGLAKNVVDLQDIWR